MEIKPYDKNAKQHPEKQVELIARSIQRFGWQQPIKLGLDGFIIVGHGRYMAYEKYGQKYSLKEPWVIDENGKTISGEPEQRKLTEAEEKAYRLADNQINALSGNDNSLVIEELKEIDLDNTGLVELTGYDRDLIIEPEENDDDVPEVPKEPISKLGDLYELGNHRVLCGDSTSMEDVSTLMQGLKADIVVTDPPYNTGMQGNPGDEKARLSHMFNDKIENWEQFLSDIFTNYILNTKGDCAFYVFIDWRKVGDIRQEMEKHMDVKNVIVWDKKVHGLGSDYKSTYELCIVGKKGNPEIQNRFGLDYQDIWRLQREMGRNKDHATAKPVELCEKPIKHASKADDIVMDLFLGSGSTLIASEKTQRACYGMELDPKYVDVIVSRYVKYTGNNQIIKNGELITWQEDQQN